MRRDSGQGGRAFFFWKAKATSHTDLYILLQRVFGFINRSLEAASSSWGYSGFPTYIMTIRFRDTLSAGKEAYGGIQDVRIFYLVL